MTKNNRSIFYNGDMELDLHSLNQIIQSVICFSDFVWVNCDVRASSILPKESQERIDELLEALRIKGRIKFWGYPHQESPAIRTIKMQEYKQVAEKINETFLTERELLPTVSYAFIPLDETRGGVETTSKIISLRKEYWSLALSDLLGSDRVMVGPEHKTTWLTRSHKLKYATVEGKIIEYILKDFCHIPDLTCLEAKDIVKLQSLSRPFREKIETISKATMFDFRFNGKELKETGNELTDSIWEFLDRTDLKNLGKGVAKESFYAVSTFFYPYLALLPFGERFLSWLNKRRKLGYVFFMSELRRRARKKTERD